MTTDPRGVSADAATPAAADTSDDSAPGPAQAESTRRRVLRYLRTSAVAAPLILVAITLAVSFTITLRHTDQFSPVDEYMYYDALYKFEDHGMVRQGEDVEPESVERIGCTGVFYQGQFGPECPPKDRDVKRLPTPFEGKTTADAYTPLYIASAYYGSKIFQALGADDLLLSARLTSPLWLGAGILMLYVMLRSFGIRKWLAVGLGLCFVGSPIAWWSGTFLTTDAPGLFFGALILWLARRLVLGRSSGWWLVLAATLAVLVKVTHVLEIGAAVLYIAATFFFRLTPDQRRSLLRPSEWKSLPRIRWLGYCVAAVAIPVAAQLAWLQVRAANAVGPVPDVIAAKFGFGEFVLQTMNFLSSTFDWNVSPGPIYPMPPYLSAPLMWMVLLSVVGSVVLFRTPQTAQLKALRVSTVWAGVLAAPMLAAALFITQGYYFSIPGRYALTLTPLFLLFIGKTLPKRYLTPALLTYGAITIVWALYYSFTPGHF